MIIDWLKWHKYKPRTFWAWLRGVPRQMNVRDDAIAALNDEYVGEFKAIDYYAANQFRTAATLKEMANEALAQYGTKGVVHVSSEDWDRVF